MAWDAGEARGHSLGCVEKLHSVTTLQLQGSTSLPEGMRLSVTESQEHVRRLFPSLPQTLRGAQCLAELTLCPALTEEGN